MTVQDLRNILEPFEKTYLLEVHEIEGLSVSIVTEKYSIDYHHTRNDKISQCCQKIVQVILSYGIESLIKTKRKLLSDCEMIF